MIRKGIDDLQNFRSWQELFNQLPPDKQSPFYSPAYYIAYMQIERTDVRCMWFWKDENNFLFYPFLFRSVNALGYELDSTVYDISGGYGYNGPTGASHDNAFIENCNNEILLYFAENNVVTEFVRYCPITHNRSLHLYTDQIDVLDNVFVDLSHGSEWVWNQSFSSDTRRMIRKAESYCLTSKTLFDREISDNDIRIFYDIYTSTMERNNADQFYFFKLDFFRSLVKNLGEMVMISHAMLEDQVISSEITFIRDKLAFAFLAGTRQEYYQFRSSTYLRWQIIRYLVEHGISIYNLGGGSNRGDSVYAFKKAFSKKCDSLFFIGTKVHNKALYEQIRLQWAKKHSEAAMKYSNLLQGYRVQRVKDDQ